MVALAVPFDLQPRLCTASAAHVSYGVEKLAVGVARHDKAVKWLPYLTVIYVLCLDVGTKSAPPPAVAAGVGQELVLGPPIRDHPLLDFDWGPNHSAAQGARSIAIHGVEAF